MTMARYSWLLVAIRNQDLDDISHLSFGLQSAELGQALLHSIELFENLEIISALLSAGANVDHQDEEGRTPVFTAVKYSRVRTVKHLIEHGCNVNLGKHKKLHCLHLAAVRGNIDIVQWLIRSGHDLNATNWAGNTPVLIACRFDRIEVVELLLRNGADVSIPNKMGHYPLHYAAVTGNKDLVKILLSHGALPGVRTHLSIRPVMLACDYNHCSIVRLLAKQCDLNIREMLLGGSVLHWAAMSGCETCFEILLVHGASLDVVDSTGRTPLIQAIQSKHSNIVNYILSKTYTDLWISTTNYNMLHFAVSLVQKDAVEIICKNKRTKRLINHQDCFNDTPLDIALISLNGCTEEMLNDVLNVIKSLISYGGKCSSNSVSGFAVASDANKDGKCTEERECGKLYCAAMVKHTIQQAVQSKIPVMKNSEVSRILDEINIGSCACCSRYADATLEDKGNMVHENVNQLFLGQERAGLSLFYMTYSPVKMAIIDKLTSAESGQLQLATEGVFDLRTWLDSANKGHMLKVTSLELAEWTCKQTHNPWPLRELCRGNIRHFLGYRANEKISRILDLPEMLRDYLSLKELHEIKSDDLQIKEIGNDNISV